MPLNMRHYTSLLKSDDLTVLCHLRLSLQGDQGSDQSIGNQQTAVINLGGFMSPQAAGMTPPHTHTRHTNTH